MIDSPAARIRTLFLQPKAAYSFAEAAALFGVPPSDLDKWVDGGEMEAVESNEGPILPWAELVSFGMDFWSHEAVEEALGAAVAGAIPELLRLTDLHVRIPRLEVVAIERLAARDGVSRDALLARELRDVVSAHSEWLSREVAGLADALAWPEPLPIQQDRSRSSDRRKRV